MLGFLALPLRLFGFEQGLKACKLCIVFAFQRGQLALAFRDLGFQRPGLGIERLAQIVAKLSSITRYKTKKYVGETEILDLDASAVRK